MPYMSYQNAYGQQKINECLSKNNEDHYFDWAEIILETKRNHRRRRQELEDADSECEAPNHGNDREVQSYSDNDSSSDSDGDSNRGRDDDSARHSRPETKIFEQHMQKVIRAYVDYTHQGEKVPLHPRRFVPTH